MPGFSLKLFSVLFCLSAMVSCTSKSQSNTSKTSAPEPNTYDSTLAATYGADDYGMKTYVMAFLYRGPNRGQDQDLATELMQEHLKNIDRMAEDGDLIIAGPFYGNDSLRGIYIFDVATIEEAEALTNTDPAIKAGMLAMDLKQWYGPAALMGLDEIHPKLTKKSITE